MCVCVSLSVCVCVQPCHLRDWELQVHFKVHGQGKKNLNGDGLAVWYTQERMQKGQTDACFALISGQGWSADDCRSSLTRLQVRCLETGISSQDSACLWTRTLTRRSCWRYRNQTQPHDQSHHTSWVYIERFNFCAKLEYHIKHLQISTVSIQRVKENKIITS